MSILMEDARGSQLAMKGRQGLLREISDLEAELARTKKALEMAMKFVKEMQLAGYHHLADEVSDSIRKELEYMIEQPKQFEVVIVVPIGEDGRYMPDLRDMAEGSIQEVSAMHYAKNYPDRVTIREKGAK